MKIVVFLIISVTVIVLYRLMGLHKKKATRGRGLSFEEARVEKINQSYRYKNYNLTVEPTFDDIIKTRKMEIIYESYKLAENSPHYGTRISRIDVAITMVQELILEYPKILELAKLLQEFTTLKGQIHAEEIQKKVQSFMDKAVLCKTINGKISNANKALVLLNEAKRNEFLKKRTIHESIAAVNKFIYEEELRDYKLKAERFEFKGETKKAISAYQDALFYLKKDDIDDSQQSVEIAEVEAKIQLLQVQVQGIKYQN